MYINKCSIKCMRLKEIVSPDFNNMLIKLIDTQINLTIKELIK